MSTKTKFRIGVYKTWLKWRLVARNQLIHQVSLTKIQNSVWGFHKKSKKIAALLARERSSSKTQEL